MAKFGSDYQGLAHHWVYNTDYSECYGLRMFSENDKIYSYGHHFIIAQKLLINEEQVYLVNSDGYSATTNKQKWAVRSAIPSGRMIFEVPDAKLNHKNNIMYYFDAIELLAEKESRARSVDYKPSIVSNINELNKYIELFKPDKRNLTKLQKQVLNFDLNEDIQDLIELLTGIRNERIRINKKKEAKINKIRIAKDKENLAKWLNFETSHGYFSYLDKIYLRYDKENGIIQTSNSASITLEEAKTLHAKVERAEKLLGDKVGNFSIVEAGNVFKIGCTTLTREIMNDMCKQLNLKEVF